MAPGIGPLYHVSGEWHGASVFKAGVAQLLQVNFGSVRCALDLPYPQNGYVTTTLRKGRCNARGEVGVTLKTEPR